MLFLVCIDRPEVDPTQRQVEYDRQKQLLSQGRKPEKRWREMAREVEAEDFVNQYGQSVNQLACYFLCSFYTNYSLVYRTNNNIMNNMLQIFFPSV